jgi:hypothetical protein
MRRLKSYENNSSLPTKGTRQPDRKKEAWKEQYLKMASRCDALQAEMETERCSALDKEHDLLKTVTNHEAYKTLSKWYSEAVDELCRVRKRTGNLEQDA